MNFVDTHCHIHFPDYGLDPEEVIAAAHEAGVTRLMAVGCTLSDSHLAVDMAQRHNGIWASIGLHPHEASQYVPDDHALQQFRELATKPGVVAVGECGLDYHYMHSSKQDQQKLFRFQLDLAQEHNLPLIFHVREAFDDFWQIVADYPNIRGVLHSFTDSQANMQRAVDRGWYIGVNGIATFAKMPDQLDVYRTIPLEHLLLETDAPFLTPTPYRGTICEPKHVVVTAEFLSRLRGENMDALAERTTHNARTLFGIE